MGGNDQGESDNEQTQTQTTDGENGGDQTQTADGGGESVHATFSDVDFQMTKVPYLHTVREALPESSNGRFDGEVRQFNGGTLSMQALVAGSIDIHGLSLGPVYQANIAGNDLKIVGTKLVGSGYVIVVREDIESLDAFTQDAEFGISSPGGLSTVQSIGVFQEEGINPDDVNMVSIGGSGDRTQAIAAGNIDGTVIWLDQYESISDQGVKNMGELREYFPNITAQTIAVRNDWLQDEAHQEFIQEFLNGLVAANERATNDFDWVYEKYQQFQAQPLDEEEARETWEWNAETLDTWPTGEFAYEGYEAMLNMLDGAGQLDANDLDLDQIIEDQYWNNAVDNL